MNGHRLAVLLRQAVDGVIDGIGEPDLVVPGVELDSAARILLQVRLHLVGQIRRNGLSSPQYQTVQAHAVVEQVRRVLVEAHFQTAVAHDHPVDHAQLAVDRSQVIHRVFVAHRLGHGVGPGL